MKQIFVLMLVFCATTVFAQEKKSLKEDECYQYAMVSFDRILSSKKYYIEIQEGGAVDKPHKMTDENESEIYFPTWIDALNYLSTKGWEIAWHNSNTNMMEQWILKKAIKKEKLENLVNDNLTVKQKKK